MSEERLRQELETAFKNRAMLYENIYDRLARELGPERAEIVLGEAIYQRGKETAEAAFSQFGPQDAGAIGSAFLSVSPDGGKLFPTEVAETEAGGMAIQVRSCPLKQAWHEAGLDAGRIATLCRIAGRFDNGLFETTGIAFRAETWQHGKQGCCRLVLENAAP